jgi:diphosphomevalonate decarboxylase
MSEQSIVVAKAPSNIALIKYMGKKDESRNIPMNPSLSLTLSRFATVAELTSLDYQSSSKAGMRWVTEIPKQIVPEPGYPWVASKWNEAAIARIDRFVARLSIELPPVLQRFGLSFRPLTGFELRTANTFPQATGLASSASAFAAVTLAFAAAQCVEPELFRQLLGEGPALRSALAAVSKLGSGSSCRSLLGPWVLWNEEQITPVSADLPEYADLVILFKASPKAVSSSEAHRRVSTSSAWRERPERAQQRCQELVKALESGNAAAVARLSWQDSWDMHHLFHTADPAFTYWEPETFAALKWLMTEQPSILPRPIVTLDAGPNLHMLVPLDSAVAWKARIAEAFPESSVLEDKQGLGAELLRG